MTHALPRGMTVAEFLSWQGGDPNRHYELIDGQIVMMAPTTHRHARIVANLIGLLDGLLPDGSAFGLAAAGGIGRPDREHQWYEADVVVSALKAGVEQLIERPIVVAEVLSASTEHTDRSVKAPDYRAIDSVQEILFIEQNRPLVETVRRTDGDRWLSLLAIGLDAEVRLDSLGVSFQLRRLYRRVSLDDDGTARHLPT